MSQPTLSRLENLAQWRAPGRIGLGMIDLFCRSFATPPARIELDIDDTEDAVYGGQRLALFNAHYDSTCYLPIHIPRVKPEDRLRGRLRQAGVLPPRTRQAPLGQGGGAHFPSRHRPHPQPRIKSGAKVEISRSAVTATPAPDPCWRCWRGWAAITFSGWPSTRS